MTLQKKVIIVIISTALVLLLITLVVSGLEVEKSYSRLEKTSVEENLQRIANAMDNKLAALDNLAADWAVWDDTYRFVEDKNEEYLRSNFTDSAFSYTDLNLIAIIDTSGNVVAAKSYDLVNEVETPVSLSIYYHLSDPAIAVHDNVESRLSFIISLPEGPLLLVSRPILTSEAEGPIRGAVIMGRYLDATMLASLAETTLLQVSAYPVNSDSIPNEILELVPSLVSNQVVLKPSANNMISGYTIMNDMRGRPYLIMKIDMPRTIRTQAREMLLVTHVGIIAIFAIFLLVNIWFLEKAVLSRLRKLGSAVIAIRNSGDISMRVPVDGKDELATLSSEINSTMAKLSESENALKESENKYSTLVESSNDGIIIIKDGLTVYANPRLLEMTGRTLSDNLGRPFLEYIHEDDRDRASDYYQKRLGGKLTPEKYEIGILNKNGNSIPVEINAKVIYIGDSQCDMVVLRDISERKEAERQLRYQKDMIDRILVNTPSAVFVVGPDQRISITNQALPDLLGMGTMVLVGMKLEELLPEETLLDAVNVVFKTEGATNEIEFVHRVNDTPITLIASIINIQKGDVLLILRDVTKERERQEKLYLTDRLASVGEMASGIAHELNNPLTGVMGLSQLLLEGQLPEDIKDDVNAISNEAQRAAAIVRNLLMFARKHAPVREQTQINTVIEDVLKLRAYEHKVNNIDVSYSLTPGLPEISADHFQIQQVFLNIILNAEQAMMESHGKGKLTIKTEPGKGTVKITLSDDGPGIRTENLKRIFDPFFTTKEVGKGTGLGLSISYGIITSHGGRIYAESEYGHGATFIIELPVTSCN
jgi:PAS domain S-box-containing protein